jgi:hypothetical protein
VESAIPFLSVAMKCASSRNEFHHLKELLSRGIAICTEHVSNDQSCNRDALSAFTLSRLVEMHVTATARDTFRYTLQTKYQAIRSYFTFFFPNKKVVPLLFHSQLQHQASSVSFDNMNFMAEVDQSMSSPQPCGSVLSSVSII